MIETLEKLHTRAERIVCTLELLAWREVLTLSGDTLEVVGVVLETASPVVGTCVRYGNMLHTNAWSGWCWENELLRGTIW